MNDMSSDEQQPKKQKALTTAALCCCGALAGGIAGLIAGLGAIALPGLGPLIATFPLTVAGGGSLIGAAIGGMIAALDAWDRRTSHRTAEHSRFEDNVRLAKQKAAGA